MPAPQAKTPSTTTPSASAPTTGSPGAKSQATPPAIPAAHTPTPAQQNPNVRRPLAPYLPEANPNAPQDPQKAFAERQKAAIESRLKDPQKAAVAASGVDPQTSKTGSQKASSPGSTGSSTPAATKETSASTALESLSKAAAPEAKGTDSASSDPKPETTSTDSPEATSPATARGPRYEVKAMRKWAEENPDQAAEIAVQVFGKDQDSTSEWIRIQNKKRKLRGELKDERQKTVSEARAEREQAAAERAQVDGHRKVVQPLVDLFEAGARRDAQGNFIPDFDAVEAAFEQCTQGLKLDDFMRMRARRGGSNPEAARLRAENARQASELEKLRPKQAPAAETPAAPAAKPKPPAAPALTVAQLEEKWNDEIDPKHPLRQFGTWAKELEKAMSAYHDEDLDEYSRDPEDVAGDLLKKKLAEFTGEEEEAPAAKPKPGKPKVKVKGREPAKDEIPSAASLRPKVGAGASAGDDDEPKGFADRQRWALERHNKRIRGELT